MLLAPTFSAGGQASSQQLGGLTQAKVPSALVCERYPCDRNLLRPMSQILAVPSALSRMLLQAGQRRTA
jgi:hypothetical protein